jgi:cysteinyl-tRNA synthetase
LKFPHHENEIAQNHGACGTAPARYWMHGNMLLMNGKKMSKSDGNSILPLWNSSAVKMKYFRRRFHPWLFRFFMMQSHYRSTLDITFDALKAAEKGFSKIKDAYNLITNLKASPGNDSIPINSSIVAEIEGMYEDMNNDFNTPKGNCQNL